MSHERNHRMTVQPDLFVPEFPAEVRAALDTARANLRKVAEDIDGALAEFFEQAWAECWSQHEVPKDGGKTEMWWGTPNFNRFDSITGKFDKVVSKMRWMLWEDINDTAKAMRAASDGERGYDKEGKA